MKWDDVSFVLRSVQRKKIILVLETPLTPTYIAKKTGISLSNVGTKVGDLKKKGIVKCLTPNVRKGKIYGLTRDGKEILEKIKKMEK